jgi:hypothetical protein
MNKPPSQTPVCSVCHNPVKLETAKTDEHGKPTHEECYLAKISRKIPLNPRNPPATQY